MLDSSGTIEVFGSTEPTLAKELRSELRVLQQLIDSPPRDLTKLMKISPNMARAMMTHNASDEWKNRRMSGRGLRRYSASMKKGWVLTGETIIFSKSGRLLNGQTRLTASIETASTFECLVVFGVADDAFKFMDTGIVRSASHIFDIEGIANASMVAAVARLANGYQDRHWTGRPPEVENDELLAFYDKHCDRMQESLRFARMLYAERLMPVSWGGFCWFVCAQKNKEAASAFFEQIATGVGITSKKTPVWQVRDRLLRNARAGAAPLDWAYAAAYLIKAWNAYRLNQVGEIRLRWRDTESTAHESFPRAL